MKLKFDRTSLLVAAILSLLTLVILLVGLVTPVNVHNAFAATIVLQLGTAGLWILAKWGAFKGMFRASRKMARQKMEKFREKHQVKEAATSAKEPLGYIGPLAMLAFGFLEILIYLIYIYA